MDHKLLLLTRDNEQYRDLIINSALPELILLGEEPHNIKEADIWLADPILAAPLLGHATNLTWLQSTSAEVDALMHSRLRKDYLLTNIQGMFDPLLNEYLFSYLLATRQQQSKDQQQQTTQVWLPDSYKMLQGEHILLMGTDSVACHIATAAKHFGMKVSGINRKGTGIDGFDRVSTLADLEYYISQADTIVNLLPSTPQTQGILNKRALSLMKPNALLFNLGRVDILDLDAMKRQLSLQPEQQVILDIFNQETLPADHPIRHSSNATITPCIATTSFPEQVMEIFAHNYKLFLRGQALSHQVSFQKGY